MKVKYIVRENGKFAVKDEKFLPPLHTYDSQKEAEDALKKELASSEEKFEIQVQQENGEFRLLEIEPTIDESLISEEAKEEPAPEVVEEKPAEEPTPEVVEEKPAEEPAPIVTEEKPQEVEVATKVADATVVTATAVKPIETTKEETTTEEKKETMNVESVSDSTKVVEEAKVKFQIQDLWKNPEYRKWLYLGIAVFIEVAIIIAIIVLIAQ